MQRRILLLMMTALLSVGAWAENLWNGEATITWSSGVFKLETASKGLSSGDVLIFSISNKTTDDGLRICEHNSTNAYWPGNTLETISTQVGTIKMVVTDAIATAAGTELWIAGNGFTITSVDLEKKTCVNVYTNESGNQMNYWYMLLDSQNLKYAKVGDYLRVTISVVGENNNWRKLYIQDKAEQAHTENYTGNILYTCEGDRLTTGTLDIWLTNDMITLIQANSLYIGGFEYTFTAVDLFCAYDVAINDMTNGTVSTDKSRAVPGETVTLTVTPDGNYELGTLTVTDESSNEIAVTNNGDGTYTFTMPATAVTVNATFNHVSAVTLDTENIKLTNSQRHNEEDGTVKLWIDTTEENGWDLTIGRPVSSSEFSGVKVEYAEAYNVQMVITYVDGTTDTQSFTAGSGSNNSDVVNFASGKIVTSIKFSKPTSTENGMIQFKSRTAVSLQIKDDATYTTPTTSMTLTYETLEDTGMDGETATVTYDKVNKTFTIASGDGHWAFWDFTLPIPTSLYNGINFTLTEAPAGSAIEIVYADETVQQENIESAVSTETNFNVNFDRTGSITRIRFAGAGTYKMGTCTAKPAKYQVTVSTAKYATFGDLGSPDVIDYSSADPSGLEAFIVTDYDPTTGKVKLTKVSKATANTAVVLYANINTSTSYTVQTAKAAETSETSDNVDGNKLHISDGTVTGNGSTIYVLANKEQGVGFYQLANDVTIPADKAYLKISGNTLQAPAFIGFGDDTTGISKELRVKSEEFATAQYYDLQGRRVAQPSQGLYIVNGKKVVIK